MTKFLSIMTLFCAILGFMMVDPIIMVIGIAFSLLIPLVPHVKTPVDTTTQTG